MAQYSLIGSYTSPYVRRFRLLLENIPYEFKAINYLDKNDAEFLKTINPINKIPVLMDGSQSIWDSRIIFNHLNYRHRFIEMDLNLENVLTAIDGAQETLVNLFMQKRAQININQDNFFYNRQHARVELIFDYLSPHLERNYLKQWNYLSMSLYSLLDWASFREMIDLSKRPNFKNWMSKFSELEIVKTTAIPK